jgi:hypothetical protein
MESRRRAGRIRRTDGTVQRGGAAVDLAVTGGAGREAPAPARLRMTTIGMIKSSAKGYFRGSRDQRLFRNESRVDWGVSSRSREQLGPCGAERYPEEPWNGNGNQGLWP